MVYLGVYGITTTNIIKKLYQLFHHNIQEMVNISTWKNFLGLNDVLDTVNTETLFELNKDIHFKQVIDFLIEQGWNGQIPQIFITKEQFANTQYIPIKTKLVVDDIKIEDYTKTKKEEQDKNKKEDNQKNKNYVKNLNNNVYVTFYFHFKSSKK